MKNIFDAVLLLALVFMVVRNYLLQQKLGAQKNIPIWPDAIEVHEKIDAAQTIGDMEDAKKYIDRFQIVHKHKSIFDECMLEMMRHFNEKSESLVEWSSERIALIPTLGSYAKQRV
jgi:hypothetical protein